MMIYENDPQTLALISYRQKILLAEAERGRLIQATPSPLRIAVGLMLIRFGERVRGCTQPNPELATPQQRPEPRLHHAN